VNESFDETAERIAQRGREALIERLRPAFAEAASAHADVLQLDEERVERMVQRAAEQADGLLWRRTLASVAADELGIGLAEALGHPIVERAQELAGAPSYEEALAAIGVSRAAEPGDSQKPHEEGAEPDGAPADEHEDAAVHVYYEDAEPEDEEGAYDEDGAAELEPGRIVTFRAIHLEGLGGFQTPEPELRISFSEIGIEIARRADVEPVVALAWHDVHALEVPRSRGRRRRRDNARVLIHSDFGAATFEIPGVTSDQARGRIEPIHPLD
jgi:hypothetical protein